MAGIVLGVFDLVFGHPGIPFRRVQEVAAGEEEVSVQAAEITHGLDSGAFHFHGDAAFAFPLFKVAPGLPVHGVRRPGFALNPGKTGLLHEGGDGVAVFHGDVVRGGRIVIGSAFIPVGGGGNHDFAPGDFLVQAAASAEDDIFVRIDQGQGILHVSHAAGGADIGHIDGKVLSFIGESVNGICPVGGIKVADLFAVKLLQHILQDIMGEGQDAGIHLLRVFVAPYFDDLFCPVIKSICDHDCLRFPVF